MWLIVQDYLLKQANAVSLTDMELSLEKTDRVTLYQRVKTFEEHGIWRFNKILYLNTMNFYLFQKKLSQIEDQLKSNFASLVLNSQVLILSEYVDAICVFINDFDVVKFFGEDIIDYSYLECHLNINKHQTNVEFEWDFRTHDYIDKDRNMIRLNLIFADRYPHNANQEKYHYHSVAIETVYKVQYFGENVLFDANLESSFHNMISDIHYQAMKNEEPIAMAIYSYSDN